MGYAANILSDPVGYPLLPKAMRREVGGYVFTCHRRGVGASVRVCEALDGTVASNYAAMTYSATQGDDNLGHRFRSERTAMLAVLKAARAKGLVK